MSFSAFEHIIKPLIGLAVTGAATAFAVMARSLVRKVKTFFIDGAAMAESTHARVGSLGDQVADLDAEIRQQGIDISLVMENGRYATFLCDEDGNNIKANDNYLELVGAHWHQIKGRGWRSFIHPDELARYDAMWEPAFADGRDLVDTLEFNNGVVVNIRIKKLLLPEGVRYRGYMQKAPPDVAAAAIQARVARGDSGTGNP